MRPLAFVDLETTGATATHDRITEIGIVEVDADGSVREWQQLVNPGMPITPFIEQLTGISDALLATAPPFAEIAEATLRRLEGRLFIAHNARFDYGFLQREFLRQGITFRAPVLCTLQLSRTLFPEHKRHNLDTLIERHGLQAAARHRALADAQLIHQFWQRIHVAPGAAAIARALQTLNTNPRLPAHIAPAILDELPEGPGIYLFYGENDQLLHVDHARDIRKSVLAHFAPPRKSPGAASLTELLRRIDWIETAGEIGARLLAGHQQKALQAPAAGEESTWMLSQGTDGLLQPELCLTHALPFDIHTACYGLFRNPREARHMLRSLAEANHLCPTLLGLEQATPGTPCSKQKNKGCRGACCGHESLAKHNMRLLSALVSLKLVAWPFDGPAVIREGAEVHLIEGWRYLGTARSDAALRSLLEQSRPPFERATYKLLGKYVRKMQALGRQG